MGTFLDEEAFPRNDKHGAIEYREVVESGQMTLALVIHSEGNDTSWNESLCVSLPPVLVGGEKSGNASDGDTELRWSPPGIAGEPIMPTPAVMGAHGTRWARRRGNALRHSRKRKHLDRLPTPVGYPTAAKRSTCHIHPAHWSEPDRLSLNRGRCRQETTDPTSTTSTIAFGPWVQTLLSQSTFETIGLVGQVDGPLS
jgi:hypothetical protein